MKEEIQRISQMVAEGRLSPEDAADLIDAFYAGDRGSEPGPEEAPSPDGTTPPPPPPGNPRDPFRSFVESIEKMTKEGIDSVNWQEVASQARQNARKGVEAVRSGIEDLSKGKVHFGRMFNQEVKEVELPLSLEAGQVLKIDNPSGNVKVVGGHEQGSVTAHARFRAASLEEARAKASEYTLIVEESDHAVQIKQPDVSGLSVDLEVQLAASSSVEIRSESGDVQVINTNAAGRVSNRNGNVLLRGLSGAVEVSSENGNIDLEDIGGPSISVENKNGNVRATRVRGNLSVRSAAGNIDVSDGSCKIISLETVDGNVSLNLEEPVTGTVNVRTVSGNSSVAVPDQSDCRVSLSTLRGSVSSNLQLSDEAKTDTRLTGKLGQGSGTLDVSAVTGDIILEMRSATVSA